MYELVPPKSKLVDFKTILLPGIVFKIKILDFEEDEKYSSLLLKNAREKDGEFEKDENGHFIIEKDQYYIDCFKLFVPEIEGITGKFQPSWQVIKSVVNKATMLNSVQEAEK